MTAQDFEDQLAELREMLGAQGVDAGAIPVRSCRHAPRGRCKCRKPRPGMLFALMGRAGVGPERTLFVGDREPDRGAASAAGCRFAWVWDFPPEGHWCSIKRIPCYF